MYNYTPQATHHESLILIRRLGWSGRHPKKDTQTVCHCLGVFLLSFLFCFLRLAYKSRRRMNRHRSTLIRRVLHQGYAFWGLEYLIFTFLPIFRQKSSKLSPKYAISSQNAETWNARYFRNYETERRENLAQNWERKMQFSDAIWWRHNKSKMADGRHIKYHFLATPPYWPIKAKFGTEMKNHMPI